MQQLLGHKPKIWEKTIFKPKQGQVQGVTAWEAVMTMWMQDQEKIQEPNEGITTWCVVRADDVKIVFGKTED